MTASSSPAENEPNPDPAPDRTPDPTLSTDRGPGAVAPGRELFVPALSLTAARAADTKSAVDTVILAMGELLGITDAFVVTSAGNVRQVRSIVEEIERAVKVAGEGRSPLRIEGLSEAEWVLMDYGDFLVHVFLAEFRELYDLEHLWNGAPRVPWAVPAA